MDENAENKEKGIVPSLPNNSNKAKAREEERAKATPQVRAHIRKRSLLERLGSKLIGEEGQGIGSYILFDILIPAAKNTIYEVFMSGLEMKLFGKARGHRDRGTSHVSYERYYRGPGESDRRSDEYIRSNHDFNDIIIEDKREALDVLENLNDIIDESDTASVADFYNIVGITPEYTDDEYGWRTLRDAYVKRVRDGYVLKLPRPRLIDEM